MTDLDLRFYYSAEELESASAYELAEFRAERLEALRQDYISARTAVMDLAKGQSVVRLTIAGKTIEYSQSDFATLRTLRDELLVELRQLLGTTANRVFRAKTSKGL
ncbi:hypothetical protein [Desulfosarcina ovata]|uniref:Uncharacterized protein n=1 Tax=Desulfosarcina ovata subsp. ovata TaxID=2752305 RepID=A0A5K8AJT1_9BACT|nr:hypothetical protein [Desulfosarcina ovata]BBO92060.1 hypothetical protein DSCOOX_52400 [Desulfosarcina ovata subsp. ovata]